MRRQARYRKVHSCGDLTPGLATPAPYLAPTLQAGYQALQYIETSFFRPLYGFEIARLSLFPLPETDRRLDGSNRTARRRRVVCALAQSPAAERRLMVWPPSTKKGQKRRIHCLFEGISRNMLDPKDGESREKHDCTLAPGPQARCRLGPSVPHCEMPPLRRALVS